MAGLLERLGASKAPIIAEHRCYSVHFYQCQKRYIHGQEISNNRPLDKHFRCDGSHRPQKNNQIMAIIFQQRLHKGDKLPPGDRIKYNLQFYAQGQMWERCKRETKVTVTVAIEKVVGREKPSKHLPKS
jgi:hypothetical protein